MTHIDAHARPPVIVVLDDRPGTAWRFAGRIVKWTDADTADVDLLLDVGFEELVTKRRRIRLAGVDAPETRSADPEERAAGRVAKSFTESQWPAGTLVEVDVLGFDKYGGRDLGRIRNVYGVDAATMILEAGHATPYDGGKR